MLNPITTCEEDCFVLQHRWGGCMHFLLAFTHAFNSIQNFACIAVSRLDSIPWAACLMRLCFLAFRRLSDSFRGLVSRFKASQGFLVRPKPRFAQITLHNTFEACVNSNHFSQVTAKLHNPNLLRHDVEVASEQPP